MRKAILIIALYSSMTFLSACGNRNDIPIDDEMTLAPNPIAETSSGEMTQEEPIPEESPQINYDEMIHKYVKNYSAKEYYPDYYLKSRYLLICDDCMCSVFIMNDFEQVREVEYKNAARIDYSSVGDLGFVDIVDKTGEKISFVFDKETSDQIQVAINDRCKSEK